MIRVERDSAFWEGIASHPSLAGVLMGMSPQGVGAVAERPDVLPLAAEHGGFFFAKADVLGMVAELHTIFEPRGWGREVLLAGIEAINLIWLCGYQLVVTHEVEANPKSRPPKTFGFNQAGDWRETPYGNMRLWTLSKAAWEQSPAAQRRNVKCH